MTLPPAKLDKLKRVFRELDVENSGGLCREVVAQVLTDQAEDIERLMVILLFEKYDKNHDSKIQFEEYLEFCSDMEGLSEKQILRKIFDYVDSDANGVLDVNEVKQLGQLMGIEVSLPDAWATIEALDSNHDDTIDFEEFCAIIGQ